MSLQIVASDPDGDTLSYSATSLPPGLSINPATGLITGTLSYTSSGSYNVTVSVSDGSLSANTNFTWTVTAATVNTGRMTGGGSVLMNDGTRVTHGFELHSDITKGPNNLEVNWGKGNAFHLENLTAASCTDDPSIGPNPPTAGFDTYSGKGIGRYNGVSGARAEWTFTDAGEPGKNDTATIKIWDANGNIVLSVSGKLNNGNHQAHAN